ncbi:MAG: hypothetical protein ACI92S_000496 [Planctomycetaceae bacterium]|jgi:hypothetical protein
MHARQRHLELRAIEAAVHLRVTRRDVTKLEDRAKTNLLSAVDSARLDELLEREMSLRRLVVEVAQELREVSLDVQVRTVRQVNAELQT